MSEEQLSALLAKLKDDAGLQEKLKSVADLDALVSMAKEAGFDVSKADLLKFQAQQTLELSDEELESVSGGITPATIGVFGTIGVRGLLTAAIGGGVAAGGLGLLGAYLDETPPQTN